MEAIANFRGGSATAGYDPTGQGGPGLSVGSWQQTQAPRMDRDVADLVDKRKMTVYVVEEDWSRVESTVASLSPGCGRSHGPCPPMSPNTRSSRSGEALGLPDLPTPGPR